MAQGYCQPQRCVGCGRTVEVVLCFSWATVTVKPINSRRVPLILWLPTHTCLTLSLPSLLRVISVKFLLHPPQKYYVTQYAELGFSLFTQLKDDSTTNSRYHTYKFLFLQGWENVLFDIRSERVKFLCI